MFVNVERERMFIRRAGCKWPVVARFLRILYVIVLLMLVIVALNAGGSRPAGETGDGCNCDVQLQHSRHTRVSLGTSEVVDEAPVQHQCNIAPT